MLKELKYLEKFYASVINDKTLLKYHLEKKEFSTLSIDVQEKILDYTIRNPFVKKYNPPISFQKFFLRTLIDAVEINGSELSESLIEAYANVLSISNNVDHIYRTYFIKDCVITLQESSSFVVNSTTGLQTWEASKYLLEWCLENASLFLDKKILELGSGIGLLGIAMIKLCHPQKYIFSDKSLDVLKVLTKNIEMNLNDSTRKHIMEKHQLSWGTISSKDVAALAADIILGADLVFDPSTIQSLIETLKIFIHQGKTKFAVVANTIRNADTNMHFISLLEASGLNYEILDHHSKHIFIYKEVSNFILYKIF